MKQSLGGLSWLKSVIIFPVRIIPHKKSNGNIILLTFPDLCWEEIIKSRPEQNTFDFIRIYPVAGHNSRVLVFMFKSFRVRLYRCMWLSCPHSKLHANLDMLNANSYAHAYDLNRFYSFRLISRSNILHTVWMIESVHNVIVRHFGCNSFLLMFWYT